MLSISPKFPNLLRNTWTSGEHFFVMELNFQHDEKYVGKLFAIAFFQEGAWFTKVCNGFVADLDHTYDLFCSLIFPV